MKLIVTLCLLYGICWNFCRAATFKGISESEIEADQKSPRATGDSNQTNNMNVGFVPLISIIANLLPRFFTRYATVPQATVQQARSINVQNEEPIECHKSEQVGLKWMDHLSPSTFYQCHFSKNCFNSHQGSCFQLRKHVCKRSQIYDTESQKCVPPYFRT
ncbi:uncharacterized protein LOC117653985 [Thrips palmi]|uniref:Uncharacterized protein LOC117653985 n=1 Tax=Thrips palmi TaxID=161013 RepID=A0A6P9ACP6_THRPL|nr:uncharacterized protein LOC117653985 [Thrips palmi]